MTTVNEIRQMLSEGATPGDIMGLVALDPESLSRELIDITLRTAHWLLNDIAVSIDNHDWTRAMSGLCWLAVIAGGKTNSQFELMASVKMHAEHVDRWVMPEEPPTYLLERMHRQAEAALGTIAPPC